MDNATDCRTLADDPSPIKAVRILIYSVILFVSLLGNTAIITITVRNARTLTTVNYFIANMAASDLLISTFAVPNRLCQIVLGPRTWLIDGIVGSILCKLVYFFQDLSTAVSIQSLVVISIERYRAIVYPYRPAVITPKRCKWIIPLIWLTSAALHGIYFYAARLVTRNNTTKCDFSWEPKFDNRETQERYVAVVLALVVFIPFCVITFTYSRIIWSLRNSEASRGSGSPTRSSSHRAENIKAFKNICAIVIAFACCVLPLYIFAILFYFVWKWKLPCNMIQVSFVAHFALYSNAAISPVISLVRFDRYRQGLKGIFKTLHIWHQDNVELQRISTCTVSAVHKGVDDSLRELRGSEITSLSA